MSISESAKKRISRCLESGNVTCGKYVREFEVEFAKIAGTAHAIAVSSGTDAVALALATLLDFGVNRGDAVIVPALSFVATGNAVLQAGLQPIFVDVERSTLNINAGAISASQARFAKAILPVHLCGKPANVAELLEIRAAHDHLYIIDDCAEAYGTRFGSAKPGQFFDMATFSMYAAHTISSIEGGMIATDNMHYAHALRSLRSHGRACACASCVLNQGLECKKRFDGGSDSRFRFDRIGFSSKMNELEAAVGLGNIENYDEILFLRKRNLTYGLERLEKVSQFISTFSEGEHETIGPHAIPMILTEDATFTRDELMLYLSLNNIDSRTLFSSMPTQCKGFEFLGHKLGDFPEAEYIGNNGLHIGCHQGLEIAQLEYAFDKIEEFVGQQQN